MRPFRRNGSSAHAESDADGAIAVADERDRRDGPPRTAVPPGPASPSTTEQDLATAPRRVAGAWTDGLGRVAVRSAQLLLVVAAAALVTYVVVLLRVVTVPFVLAVIIASAVAPVVRLLRRRGVPAGLAAWAALLTGLGALGLFGWLIVTAVRDEWDELASQAEEGLAELEEFVTNGPLPVTEAQLERGREALVELAQGEQVRSGAISGAVAAVEVVAGLLLLIVILFFLLRDGRRIWEFLLRWIPSPNRRRVDLVGERAVEVLGGYVRGTAIIAFVDAVVIGLALVILQVPLALPLAVIVFVTAFIPLVGATLAGILAALVALVANGPVVALIVVAVVVAVNQLEGDLLAPIVLGRALSLHPLVILLALSAGTVVAGVLGALFAVPLVAVAWSAITTWIESRRGPQTVPGAPAPSPSGPG